MDFETKAGGCDCGSIRYELTTAPITCYTCHCTNCQTQSGSAFSMSMVVYTDGISVTKGEPAIYTNDQGVRHSFCGRCGVRLWGSGDRMPEISVLKPGTFDDTSWVAPIAQAWVQSAQPWIEMTDKLAVYDTQPADFQDFMQLWQEAHS